MIDHDMRQLDLEMCKYRWSEDLTFCEMVFDVYLVTIKARYSSGKSYFKCMPFCELDEAIKFYNYLMIRLDGVGENIKLSHSISVALQKIPAGKSSIQIIKAV